MIIFSPVTDTGQQRYICVVCGKHYTTMYNMRQHRNIHTGSGLHSCRYCGRSFTHKHVWEVKNQYFNLLIIKLRSVFRVLRIYNLDKK